MSQNKENRGALWGNRDKRTDNSPDFTGSATVDGVEYWVSAWKRGPEEPSNRPALSFTFKEKDT